MAPLTRYSAATSRTLRGSRRIAATWVGLTFAVGSRSYEQRDLASSPGWRFRFSESAHISNAADIETPIWSIPVGKNIVARPWRLRDHSRHIRDLCRDVARPNGLSDVFSRKMNHLR